MTRKIGFYFLIFLTIINSAALVTIFYQRWDFKRNFRGMGMRPPMPPPWMEMDLKNGQRKDFFRSLDDLRAETQPIMDSLRANGTAFMEEIKASEPNIAKLDAISEQITRFQLQLRKKITANFLQLRSKMTPEQQKVFMRHFERRMMTMEMMDGPPFEMPGKGRPPFRREHIGERPEKFEE